MNFVSTNAAPEALFYFRISLDSTGQRLGVERQEPPCLELADRLGMAHGKRYVDNDISATTGKVRPEFEQLLADLTANPRPVIVWHTDRLVRVTKDLERIIATGVNIHAVHAGHFDLSTPAGRAVARTLTAWAQYEGEQKGLRQRASNLQRAEMGKPWWPRAPFGYTRDAQVVPEQAAALKVAYDKLLAGVSLSGIAKSLNAQGFRTSYGNEWTGTSIRPVLQNSRNAGIRVYNGEELGDAGWEAIVPEETWRAAAHLLSAEGRSSGGGGVRRYMLTNLLTCGACEVPMGSGINGRPGKTYAVYNCKAGGHVSMRVEWVDAFVSDVVLGRLLDPESAALWESDGDDVAGIRREVMAKRKQLEVLTDAFVDGTLSEAQLRRGTGRLRERLADLEGSLARAGASQALHGVVSAEDVAAEWEEMGVERKRTFIDSLATRITLHRRPRGTKSLRAGDVVIEWAGQPRSSR